MKTDRGEASYPGRLKTTGGRTTGGRGEYLNCFDMRGGRDLHSYQARSYHVYLLSMTFILMGNWCNNDTGPNLNETAAMVKVTGNKMKKFERTLPVFSSGQFYPLTGSN